jgi:LDH2 family malate/lactate/ureidoglycolate dehydrogenase
MDKGKVERDYVAEWLAECTDGRVSSHTITMLRTYTRWLEYTRLSAYAPDRITPEVKEAAADACFEATGILVTNKGMKAAILAAFAVLGGA